MGYANASLIYAAEACRNALKHLTQLIDESQETCTHPPAHVRIAKQGKRAGKPFRHNCSGDLEFVEARKNAKKEL